MSDEFADWIGRGVTCEDVVTERLLAEYRATLAPFLFESADDCPPGLHWGLAPATPGMTELAPDGSEARGIFLPPIKLPRRMWAGGAIETVSPIRPGMVVRRHSMLSDIKMRAGRSGALCLVSVIHEIAAGDTLLLRERQDLVFRQAGPSASAAPAPAAEASADVHWQVMTSPQLLFRFSALTFNGHRIHYDLPYAMAVEGYAGLLVHGPLQAALLLNQAAMALGRVPRLFEYRCTAPLIAGQTISVRTSRAGDATTGRIADRIGTVTCEAFTSR